MSTIRCIYNPKQDGSFSDPGFPATDQHPNAARYQMAHPVRGNLTIDALGGQPSQAEVDAFFGIDAAGQAKQARLATDESERQALIANSVLMTFVNMSPGQIDAWCTANITDLPSARNALALLAKIVNVAIRQKVRNGG